MTTTKQQNNSGRVAAAQPWLWPDTLDALIAAPQHHRLVFENEHVRVPEVRIGPGEIVPLHTHRWPGVLYCRAGASTSGEMIPASDLRLPGGRLSAQNSFGCVL